MPKPIGNLFIRRIDEKKYKLVLELEGANDGFTIKEGSLLSVRKHGAYVAEQIGWHGFIGGIPESDYWADDISEADAKQFASTRKIKQ